MQDEVLRPEQLRKLFAKLHHVLPVSPQLRVHAEHGRDRIGALEGNLLLFFPWRPLEEPTWVQWDQAGYGERVGGAPVRRHHGTPVLALVHTLCNRVFVARRIGNVELQALPLFPRVHGFGVPEAHREAAFAEKLTTQATRAIAEGHGDVVQAALTARSPMDQEVRPFLADKRAHQRAIGLADHFGHDDAVPRQRRRQGHPRDRIVRVHVGASFVFQYHGVAHRTIAPNRTVAPQIVSPVHVRRDHG